MTLSPESRKTISVVTGHVHCKFQFWETDEDFVAGGVGRDNQVEGSFFPGGYLVEEPTNFFPHAVIECILDDQFNSEKSYLNYEPDSEYNFQLHGSSQDRGLQEHFPHLAFQVGELPRQAELRMITTHAAAMVSPNEAGILILGDKGTGKTSVCVELGIGQRYKLVGNNLVIVENSDNFPHLVSGTQALVIRKSTLASIPAVAKVKEDIVPEKNSTHGRETKVIITPEKLGIETARSICDIGLIVRVNIHPGQPQPVRITKVSDGLTERLRLFENFARYIRGVATPLSLTESKISGYIPSFDTPILTSMRNQLIERLFKLPFYYVSGNSVAAVAENIDYLVRNI